MPDSCLVYLNTNNFFELNKKINSQSLVFDKLKSFEGINTLCFTLQLFDSLVHTNDALEKELEDNLLHLALYNKSCDWLLTFNIKELGKQTEVNDMTSKLFKMRPGEGNMNVFELSKKSLCYFRLQSGVVLLSNSASLVEKALNNATPKFCKSRAYLDMQSTLTEDNILSVYVDHCLYSQNAASSTLNLSPHCKKGFSAASVELAPSEIKATGYTSFDSTEILSSLTNQPGQSTESLLKILPVNMISFKAFGFGSFASMKARLVDTNSDANKDFWKTINDKALYNLKKDLDENAMNNLVSFTTTPGNIRYVALEVNDSIKAFEHLKLMSDSIYKGAWPVHRIASGSAETLSLFRPYHEGATQYACYFKSYLIFAGTKKELDDLLIDYEAQRFARNDENFSAYRSQNFTDEYNYLYYTSPSLNVTDRDRVFRFRSISGKSTLNNFRHFSYSLINDRKNFRFRLQFLNEAENTGRKQNNLWSLKLDTTSSCRPFGFVNHITNENEVFVQDDKNNIYLANAKGKLLWKKQIAEKIESGIFIVDAFKNNKFQLLFHSKNYLHLVDRNGNYVEGYPVKLAAEAVSPLCLFDYENNREYRLFIGCTNGLIYNYTIQGKLNEGFKTVRTEKEVRLPIQYVKIGQSDYLFTIDVEGKIYSFSRKGETRITLKNRAIANCSSFYVDASKNLDNSYLVYVDDKSGAINKISLTDRKDILDLNYESQSAGARYALVDDNREMDFVTTHDKNILAYNLNGGLLIDKNTGSELGDAEFYSDETNTLYYARVKDKKELLLFRPLKQNVLIIEATSMPLISELFGDTKKYLIVTNGAWLNCQPIE